MPEVDTIEEAVYMPMRPPPLGARGDIFGVGIGGLFGPDGAPAAAGVRRLVDGFDQNLRITERLDEEILYLGFLMEHYGHALLESLSRAWAIQALGWTGRLLFHAHNANVLEGPAGDFLVPLLEMAGIARERILILERPTILRRVFVPHQGIDFSRYIYEGFARLYEDAAERLAGDVVPCDTPLYIAKTDSVAHRPGGEDELVHYLRQEGFCIVHPQKLSLTRQIRLFNAHRWIVGPIGSGLHNQVFSLRPPKLSVLWCGQPYWRNFNMISAVKGTDLTLVAAGGKSNVPGCGWDLEISTILDYLKSEGLVRPLLRRVGEVAAESAPPLPAPPSPPPTEQPPTAEEHDMIEEPVAAPAPVPVLMPPPAPHGGRLSHWARLRQRRREKVAKRHLERSGLFDPAFYLSTYPDVAAAGIDAVTHYLRHGWREGRHPNDRFDSWAYLQSNPDVAAAGVPPLLHYVLYGRAEGRCAPIPQSAATSVAKPVKQERLRTVYDTFPAIDSHPSFRRQEDFPDIREPFFWQVYEKYKPFTLLGVARFYDCYTALRHIAHARIPGDIVECGVYMGGAMAAMAEFADHFGLSDRRFWLCDTFNGFPAGTTDRDMTGKEFRFSKHPSTLAVVRRVMAMSGIASERAIMLEGAVEHTLPGAAIQRIALLRLDTDYKESTRCELEHLYPKLSEGGVLIIDDYGAFEGVREAVDEYFQNGAVCMLNRIDYTGRSGVKIR